MPRGKTSIVSKHKQLELLKNKSFKCLNKQLDDYLKTGENSQATMAACRMILAKMVPDLQSVEVTGELETKVNHVVEFR